MRNGFGRGNTAIVFPAFDFSARPEARYCRLLYVERDRPLADTPLPVCCCISTLNSRNKYDINSPFDAILVGVLLILDLFYPVLFYETQGIDDHGCRRFHLFKGGDRNEGFHDE